MTKLAAPLPKGAQNGLATDGHIFLKEPGETHILIALVDTKSITADVDSGEEYATIRIRAVEAFAHKSANWGAAHRLWREAFEARTGDGSLPFGEGDDEDRDADNVDF